MAEIRVSAVIAAPAEAVWQLLQDFGNIQRWWPNDGPIRIEHVEIEGQGVGMIRHIQNHGARHRVSERLDFIDPATRTLVLSIVGTRPAAITAYVAEGRVVEIDATSCRIDYRGLITSTPGREDQVRDGITKTWSMMFAGLESAASATPDGQLAIAPCIASISTIPGGQKL
jgi:uncharacterized protein YndB with AHSA1/START domain